MSSITPTLLSDTLNLIQLARETALVQGKQDQAKRLSPVVSEMRSLVSGAQGTQSKSGAASSGGVASASPVSRANGPAPAGGVMAQGDFRTLLNAARGTSTVAQPVQASSGLERFQMVTAMAAGNMTDVDIARQMGMTRDEVHLILSVGQKSRSVPEVSK